MCGCIMLPPIESFVQSLAESPAFSSQHVMPFGALAGLIAKTLQNDFGISVRP